MPLIVKRDPSKGYLAAWLWIPKNFINLDATKAGLTKAIVDRYTGNTKILYLYREAPAHLLVPRAFWDPASLPFEVVDCRPTSYSRVRFRSHIQLDHRIGEQNGQNVLLPTGSDVQQKSLTAMQAAMGGVLQLSCGKGKSHVALELIVQGQVPAAVMVDNTQLLGQWLKLVEEFITVPGGVGIVGDGQRDWKKGLVLATYQTMASWADEMPEEVRRWFGVAIFDEGHHVSAPVFSKAASLFYGRRYCLTATPERDDGYHVIADLHVGPVLHKDLSQPLVARFIFDWTGLELDLTDPQCSVLDKNQEVHTSKVFNYFGKWHKRLEMTLQDCIDAVQLGRRVLVLANGVDEVVNLMAMWTRGAATPLITDLPYPTPVEVGEQLLPLALTDQEGKRLERNLQKKHQQVDQAQADSTASPKRVKEIEDQLASIESDYKCYLVYRKLEAENDKRRRAYIKDLVNESSTAGVLTYEVPAKMRQDFVNTRQVIFAITKYGKEGLDAPHLDTLIVSSPFSSKNGLQQLMGRLTGRPMPGKKKCVIVFYRDNIGPMHGMCEKLERHLRNWSVDENGPFNAEHLNHPKRTTWQKNSSLKQIFGQP